MSSSSYLIAAARTPLGRYLGGLSSLSACQLGAAAIREALQRSGVDPASVEECVVGSVVSAGLGQAPARQAAMGGGLPPTTSATTVNKVCGSGLQAAMQADQAIRLGDRTIMVAAGMESMSRGPHLLFSGRGGWKYGPQTLQDAVAWDGLRCSFTEQSMGGYADALAKKQGISREEQDRWAAESHRRACEAWSRGDFDAEVFAMQVGKGKEVATVSKDESPRADSTAAKLAGLRPAFAEDGTVTAGNSSPLSDGGAAVVIVDEATKNRLKPSMAFRIVAHATQSVAPEDIFTAPVGAMQRVMAKAKLSVNEIDLFELNEAFAVQVLACRNGCNIPEDRLNVNGGAIALGHPLGCSGTRVLVTLMHAMAKRNAHRGIASLCLGGGESVAMLIERCQ